MFDNGSIDLITIATLTVNCNRENARLAEERII